MALILHQLLWGYIRECDLANNPSVHTMCLCIWGDALCFRSVWMARRANGMLLDCKILGIQGSGDTRL